MSATALRVAATSTGLVTFAVVGVMVGGWWWLAAAAGALAAIGSWVDHKVVYVTVIAALASAVGAVVVDRPAVVVVVAVGVIASVELGASADRTTVVTPTVPVAGALVRTVTAAAVLSTAVAVAGTVTTGGPAWSAIAAALAAGTSLRLLAR